MRRPDFIIIGAMKCATSTLHAQLEMQRGIYMTNKECEPNFFSDDDKYHCGTAAYEAFFASAPQHALIGESSTHYTKLPTYPNTVARMKDVLGDVRLIYIMRHPIDRLVSQYLHEWTERKIALPINQALDRHSELIDYSRYAMQIEPYLEAFGPNCVCPVFFESLIHRAPLELSRIGHFIGYLGELHWDDAQGRQNASNERLRTSEWRDQIVNNRFITAFRRTLVPQSVRDWIKTFWKTKHTPTLSDATLARLSVLFNEDLRTLGHWLGMELTCDNWNESAQSSTPAWSGWDRNTRTES